MHDAPDFVIDHSDLTDKAYARLRELILQRRLGPNHKLSVDSMAQSFGISRTPVKDAFNRLAADGLLTIARNVGSFVTPLIEQDVREIFELRLMFELHAAAIGVHKVSEDQIDQLKRLVKTMSMSIEGAHYRDADMQAFLMADQRLHRFVVAQAGNKRMLDAYDALNVHVQIARAYYVKELANVQQGQREHEAIVRAYAKHDPDLLQDTLRIHIETVRDLVMDIVTAAGGEI